MQAINPSKPRLARFMTFGESRKSTSSIDAFGRFRSIPRSRSTLAAREITRQAAAMRVTRRDTLMRRPAWKPRRAIAPGTGYWVLGTRYWCCSFQIPPLKNQHRAAQRHHRIKHGIQSVLHHQLHAQRLLMRDAGNHVERRKIGNQIRRSGRNPAREAVSHPGEPAEIVGKAANHKQRKGKYRREQRRRE